MESVDDLIASVLGACVIFVERCIEELFVRPVDRLTE